MMCPLQIPLFFFLLLSNADVQKLESRVHPNGLHRTKNNAFVSIRYAHGNSEGIPFADAHGLRTIPNLFYKRVQNM